MKENNAEWADGFLFVGNHLALDFLNTKLLDGDELVEKLPDRAAFVRWCAAAEIGEIPTANGSAEEVRAFRERLREAVTQLEGGGVPDREFVEEINSLLSRYPGRVVLDSKNGRVEKWTGFAGEGVFWGAIAAAVAELLTEAEQHRVRKCEHCVVHFYDVSKKGSRRWCSMGMCGNRVKVAAYQKRRRAEG